MENLEECLYFIFIGGLHLNASWSHDGRCRQNAIYEHLCVHAGAHASSSGFAVDLSRQGFQVGVVCFYVFQELLRRGFRECLTGTLL